MAQTGARGSNSYEDSMTPNMIAFLLLLAAVFVWRGKGDLKKKERNKCENGNKANYKIGTVEEQREQKQREAIIEQT